MAKQKYDFGTVGVRHKGWYNLGTEYGYGDCINYRGSSYMRTEEPSYGGYPEPEPDGDSPHWRLIARKGERGEAGGEPAPMRFCDLYLTSGVTGVPYETLGCNHIEVVGGVPPYHIASQNIPAGLSLTTTKTNPWGGIAMELVGTSAGAAPEPLPTTVTVTDSRGSSVTRSWTIPTVGEASLLRPRLLNTRINAAFGEPHTINATVGEPFTERLELRDLTSLRLITEWHEYIYTEPYQEFYPPTPPNGQPELTLLSPLHEVSGRSGGVSGIVGGIGRFKCYGYWLFEARHKLLPQQEFTLKLEIKIWSGE